MEGGDLRRERGIKINEFGVILAIEIDIVGAILDFMDCVTMSGRVSFSGSTPASASTS